MSEALEVGTRLVALCQQGKEEQAVKELYDEKIVSIEGQGTDAMPARMEGIQAIHAKNAWWYDNHEIHESKAEGPFVGHRDDQFAVRFEIDMTPKSSGERTRMTEVALYTVKGGKVVQEEFLYRAS